MDDNRFWILASKKISGELLPSEETELELLYVQQPGYKNIIEDLYFPIYSTSISAETEEIILKNFRQKLATIEKPLILPVDEEVGEDMGDYKTKRNYKTWILVTILAAAGLFTLWTQFYHTTNTAEAVLKNNIATNPGSKSQVVLPDGTKVILNADSKLTYPDNFIGNTREVSLEGEAYFEVKSNKQKPFIIHAKAMDIKVLGTVFNVKSYPAGTVSEASLIEGSIEIILKNRKNEIIKLKPNEKISVSVKPVSKNMGKNPNENIKESKALVSIEKIEKDQADNSINEIAWTSNKLVFMNQTFNDISETLERWYGKTIIIENEKLKELRFTAKFYNENLSQVLKALQLTSNFKFRVDKNNIVIY